MAVSATEPGEVATTRLALTANTCILGPVGNEREDTRVKVKDNFFLSYLS